MGAEGEGLWIEEWQQNTDKERGWLCPRPLKISGKLRQLGELGHKAMEGCSQYQNGLSRNSAHLGIRQLSLRLTGPRDVHGSTPGTTPACLGTCHSRTGCHWGHQVTDFGTQIAGCAKRGAAGEGVWGQMVARIRGLSGCTRNLDDLILLQM